MAAILKKTSSGWDLVSATFPVDVPIRIGSTQTFTGTFETDADGHATVNCGFTPDIIVFDNFTDPYITANLSLQDRAVAMLNGLPNGSWHESYFILPQGSYAGVYAFITRPSSNGFEVIYEYLAWTWEPYPLSSDTVGPVTFTAYKF